MRFKAHALSAAAVCAAVAGVTMPAQASVGNGVSPAVVSAVAADRSIDFNIFIPLKADKRAQLEQLLQAQQDPKSAQYHHWLTPQQFAQRFGMSSDTAARLSSALSAAGLTVTHQYAQALHVSGKADAIQRAFDTQLNSVRDDGGRKPERLVAQSALKMPAALAAEGAIVADFVNIPPKHTMSRNTGLLPANRYSNVGAYWYDDLKEAYDYPSYQSYDGTGANVAILMEYDVLDSDVQMMFDGENFTLTTGQPDPTLAAHLMVNGGAPFDPNGSFEASLDVQQVIGGAPGSAVTLVDIPDLSDENVMSGYLEIVEDNQWDVVNSSFGGCEKGYGPAYNGGTSYYGILDTYDTLFMQGNSQGITFVASSGDEAGLGCPSPDYLTGGTNPVFVKGVSEPASSPHVTAVGGTNLITTTPPNPQTTPPTLTSNYVAENAFGDPEVPYDPWGVGTNVSGGYWGAGGGVSDYFKAPSYQKLVSNAGTLGRRTVPDVGMQVGGCPGGLSVQPCGPDRSAAIVVLDGELYGVIGTSVSSPEFVSALAIDIQKTGGRLGQINNFLYSQAALQNGGAPGQYTFYHRDIPGYDGAYHTYPKQLDYNYSTGNGTPDVRQLFGLQDTAPAGDPQTPSNP